MNSRLCFGFLACSFHHCCGQLTPVSSGGKWDSCWLDRLAPSAPLQHSLATDSLCSVNRSGFEPAEPSLASIALASMPPIKIDQNRREKLDLLCALPSYVITIRWSFEKGKSLLGEELKIGNPIKPTLIFFTTHDLKHNLCRMRCLMEATQKRKKGTWFKFSRENPYPYQNQIDIAISPEGKTVSSRYM